MHALKSSANGTEQHQVISAFSIHTALTPLDVHAHTEQKHIVCSCYKDLFYEILQSG